jgi:hypothetical protein
MSLRTLSSQTNSSRATPAGAQVYCDELIELHERYAPLIDLAQNPCIIGLQTTEEPGIHFVNENGDEWDEPEAWEFALSTVDERTVTLIFVHGDTGDELFFTYDLSHQKKLTACMG